MESIYFKVRRSLPNNLALVTNSLSPQLREPTCAAVEVVRQPVVIKTPTHIATVRVHTSMGTFVPEVVVHRQLTLVYICATKTRHAL